MNMHEGEKMDDETRESARSKLDVIYALLKNIKNTGDFYPAYRFTVKGTDYLEDKKNSGGSSHATCEYVLYLDPEYQLILKNEKTGKTWDTDRATSETGSDSFSRFVLENIPDDWIYRKWCKLFPNDTDNFEG